MDKTEVIEKVAQYKLLVSRYIDLEAMYLFGSFAKNTQKEDSDIDVAVIVSQLKGDYLAIAPLLWKLRRKIDTRIEPTLVVSSNDTAGFLEEIRRTGMKVP